MFVCGPTVYDYCHLGHARTFIAFDIIARYLRFKGYQLFFLMNITDVAEKLIERSKEIRTNSIDLSKKYEKYFFKDLMSLKIDSIDLFAKASEHIPEIIDQIKGLIEKGFAYESRTGVYFNVKKFHDYGALSDQTPEEISLHPLELCSTKKNPEDFSLWKKIDKEPMWNSPWGLGRPGWHIEDTAIAMKSFGSQYDIHGGALELIFPHHEAEIAQGEALSGKKPYVKFWLHTGLLKMDGQKMSKSLGNMISIRDILKSFDYKTLRHYFLSNHYRRTFNFSFDGLKKSREKIKFIEEAINNFRNMPEGSGSNRIRIIKELEKIEIDFINCMDDDFNTPKALSVIFKMASSLKLFIKKYKKIDEISKKKSMKIVLRLANILKISDI